jgi:hypothetical protein
MRSEELDLSKYNTDKINNRYLEWYDPVVQRLVTEKIALLELGVHKGGSLLLWRDYFPKALIVGIDIQAQVDFSREERIRVFQGAQQDTAFLTEVANQTAPEGFDIIIDDASHLGDFKIREHDNYAFNCLHKKTTRRTDLKVRLTLVCAAHAWPALYQFQKGFRRVRQRRFAPENQPQNLLDLHSLHGNFD